MNWFDKWSEKATRKMAHSTSRRSMLLSVGKVLIGSGLLLPVLPFDRSGTAYAAGHDKSVGSDDTTSCDYWRYCALDGYLCSCCGGSVNQCPPGTEASKVSWVGTCHNPKDGKDYLISYNDCCGTTSCGRCLCNTNERERPGYRMGVHNDVNWCMGNSGSTMFHCTTGTIVGMAE